jgi:hypothetical protein
LHFLRVSWTLIERFPAVAVTFYGGEHFLHVVRARRAGAVSARTFAMFNEAFAESPRMS